MSIINTFTKIPNPNSDLIGKKVMADFGSEGYLKTTVVAVWLWLGNDGVWREEIIVAIPEMLRSRWCISKFSSNVHHVDRDQIIINV